MKKKTKKSTQKKSNLPNLKAVPIFASEKKAIENHTDDTKIQRLLFATLVMVKRNEEYGNILAEDRKIGIEAGVKGSKFTIEEMLYESTCEDDDTEGYMLKVYPLKQGRYAYDILFEEYDTDQEPLFCVLEGERARDVFPRYFREGLHCAVCDKKIWHRTNSHQKYCEECSKEVRRKYIARKVREHRAKKKLEKSGKK